MDVKTTVSNFWSTNSTLIIKIIVGAVVLAILVVAGWYAAGKKINEFAENLRQQAILDNRPLYDNLAVLRDRTQQLENQFSIQKGVLDGMRRNQRGGASSVFKNPDKKAIASYFDNTIDSYIPDK